MSETAKTGHVAGRLKFLVCVANDAQSRTAMLFAGLRARNTGGRLALLHVVPPPEFQHWVAVGDLMREETREQAEELLSRMAGEGHARFGILAEYVVREGSIGEEILKQVGEDAEVTMLVVGAAPAADGKRTLISWLAGQLAGKLNIPLIVVPGNLTEMQLENLT